MRYIMEGYYIARASFVTKKRHLNRPDELKFVDAKINKGVGERVEIYLDSEFIGTVPYNKNSRIISVDGYYMIKLVIEKPENIDNVPFRHQMKMYDLFGKIFVICNGNKNHEVYKKDNE